MRRVGYLQGERSVTCKKKGEGGLPASVPIKVEKTIFSPQVFRFRQIV